MSWISVKLRVKSSDARDSVDSFNVIVYDAVNNIIVCHRPCDDGDLATHLIIDENTTKLNMIIPYSVRDQCKLYMVTHPYCRDILAGPLFAVEAFIRTGDALFAPLISDQRDHEFLLEIAYALFDTLGPNFSLVQRPGYSSFMYKPF